MQFGEPSNLACWRLAYKDHTDPYTYSTCWDISGGQCLVLGWGGRDAEGRLERRRGGRRHQQELRVNLATPDFCLMPVSSQASKTASAKIMTDRSMFSPDLPRPITISTNLSFSILLVSESQSGTGQFLHLWISSGTRGRTLRPLSLNFRKFTGNRHFKNFVRSFKICFISFFDGLQKKLIGFHNFIQVFKEQLI